MSMGLPQAGSAEIELAHLASQRASEETYRLLFESNPHPMWVYDRETLAFLAVNNAAVEHYGYSREEFLGMTLKEIRPREDVRALLENVARVTSGLDRSGIWRHLKKDGTVIEVEVHSHTLSFAGRPAELVLAYDVTERRHLEEQLRQSQKMEAVGRLAGGVAHDFNNLLTAISGYTQLLLEETPDGDPRHRDLEEIYKHTRRASDLVRQLMLFSRRKLTKPVVCNLNLILKDILKLLRRVIGEDIELVTHLPADLERIRADPGQIEQVLVNLAVNARDAMPEGGRLTIETANLAAAPLGAGAVPELAPGPWVALTVSDDGHGMDRETLSHIFEPFFTTKPEGQGSGVGLAVVYSVVRQHGGSIRVHSEPGRGATFHIYLPAARAPFEPLAPDAAVTDAAARAALRGTEILLLVEDETAVRDLIQRALEDYGYTVLSASDPRQAARLFEAHRSSIDLLIADVVMPVTDGPTLYQILAGDKPDLKVLFLSGYTGEVLRGQGVLKDAPFLQKPLDLAELAQTVRSILDG